MLLLLGLCLAVLSSLTLRAAFQRGYALGERHGRENEREERARWQYASPPLTAEELDQLRLAAFGLNGSRADALELLS